MESTTKVPIDIAGLGRRLHMVRQQREWTLQRLAAKVGCDRSYLSRLETGKALNPSADLVRAAAAVLGINEEWLLLGIGDPFVSPHVPDDFDIEFLSAFSAIGEQMTVDQIVQCLHRIIHNPSFPPKARSFWVRLFAPWLKVKLELEPATAEKKYDKPDVKHSLTSLMPFEPRDWVELRAVLRLKTQSSKAKAALAKQLGVSLAAVSQWRSGATAPTADKTLQILTWVRGVEAKPRQKKRAGTAAAGRATKIRKGKSKSNPKSGMSRP